MGLGRVGNFEGRALRACLEIFPGVLRASELKPVRPRGSRAHPPVFHFVIRVEHIQRSLVVGDHDHGGSRIVGNAREELHDLPPALAIQGRGRLVGQDHAGLIGEGPSDGNPLLLPPGQHRRKIVGTIVNSQVLQQLPRTAASGGACGSIQFERHLHIFDGRQKRDQVRFLEHETDVSTPKGTQVGMCLRTVQDQRSPNPDLPRGRWVNEADGGQKGRFPGAARPQQRDHLAAPHVHRAVPHRDHFGVATAVNLCQPLGFDRKLTRRDQPA